jgi:hypothetical protein
MCETDAAQGAHVRGSDGVRMCVQDADGQGAGVPGSAGVRAGALRDRLARDRLLPQPPPPLLRKQGSPAAPRVLAVGAAWLPSGPCTRASECAWAAHERHAHTNNARERACAPPSRSRGARCATVLLQLASTAAEQAKLRQLYATVQNVLLCGGGARVPGGRSRPCALASRLSGSGHCSSAQPWRRLSNGSSNQWCPVYYCKTGTANAYYTGRPSLFLATPCGPRGLGAAGKIANRRGAGRRRRLRPHQLPGTPRRPSAKCRHSRH